MRSQEKGQSQRMPVKAKIIRLGLAFALLGMICACADGQVRMPNLPAENCLSGNCHQPLAARIAVAASVHTPVRARACTACHRRHAEDNKPSRDHYLIRAYAPGEQAKNYRQTDYDLCWTCHNLRLVTAAKTASATRFRDGDRNLHSEHLLREARSCGCCSCHDPHASVQASLIVDLDPDAAAHQGAVSISFRPSGTGGSCAPRCHDEVTYDRTRR